MYEEFFGLSRRPFASVPAVEQYFPGTAMEAARQTLSRCVERSEGTGMVIGPSGSGKTLLCQLLAQQFEAGCQVVCLASGRLSTRRALLQAILFGLNQPYRGMDEGESRLALVDVLTSAEKCPQGVLLLVDEAHTLPLRLLDEVRMLTNLVSQGRPCLRLVLAGGPILEERLASPKLESFSQRVVARCYLESFNRTETEQYVVAQVQAAGGMPDRVLSLAAAQAVYQATDGVPRLINQVCDHALLLAATRGKSPVDRAEIEEAWADLQQLPTPWNDTLKTAKLSSSVVEFGGLDDDADPEDSQGSQEPVPILRMSRGGEEAVEPADQVARIQRALAELDRDFQPASAIGPEVELNFDDAANPFSEPFAEEEIVVDRYSQCEGERPALPIHFARPEVVRAPEVVDAPSAMLPPVTERPAPAVVAVEYGELPDEDESPAALSQRPGFAAVLRTDPATDGEHEDEFPKTVPLRGEDLAPIEDETEDEEDMIVVEDGYDDVEVERLHPAAPVARQEYRQLFARLRRSC